MLELINTRDVIVYQKAVTFTAEVPAILASSGWVGGQFFNWATSSNLLSVSVSDGITAGFSLWGSDESADKFTSMSGVQSFYRYVVLGAGGWIIATTSYEHYTYASRSGGGPLVELAYGAGVRLLVSLRGYLTVEDEWTLSGDPRAPNSNYVGSVARIPTAQRRNYLTAQVSI